MKLETMYVPASDRPRRPESVSVEVVDGGRMQRRIRMHQSDEPLPDALDWEQVEHGDRRILFLHHTWPEGPYEAKTEIDGTHVRASGNLDREAFIDIVASLEPAPTSLPPMVET